MKTILLTNKYPEGPRVIIESIVPEGFHLLMLEEVSQDDFLSKVSQADYILASGRLKINKEILDKAHRLKMIQRTGVGLDSLDLKSIKEKSIPLYVNQGINSNSVAEHTLLLILGCLRRLPEIVGNTKDGKWIKQAQGVRTHELFGKTVGIIGLGKIGQKVASLLNAFGANVITHTFPPLKVEEESIYNVRQVDLETLLSDSDIITLHCPLTPETKDIVRHENISKMKEGVIIVNTARGGLINESDLRDVLDSGHVSYAGLDTFAEEPPKDWTLILHPHVIATPHIAGVTYDSFHQMMSDAMRNIMAFEEGKLDEISQYKML